METEAATILQLFAGLRGTLSVTFEEGTWSVWPYDLLHPHINKLWCAIHGRMRCSIRRQPVLALPDESRPAPTMSQHDLKKSGALTSESAADCQWSCW